MTTTDKPPRILVADDDMGVIAAYRYVLQECEADRHLGRQAGSGLEQELFGDGDDAPDEDTSWRVHFVDQGDDAVAAVRKAVAERDPFTAVFLDISMPPGIDGYEAAEEIRKIDPLVHIVFVSAYSGYDEEDLLDVAGPPHRVSILPKPVWPLDLKAKAIAICRDARRWRASRDAVRRSLAALRDAR